MESPFLVERDGPWFEITGAEVNLVKAGMGERGLQELRGNTLTTVGRSNDHALDFCDTGRQGEQAEAADEFALVVRHEKPAAMEIVGWLLEGVPIVCTQFHGEFDFLYLTYQGDEWGGVLMGLPGRDVVHLVEFFVWVGAPKVAFDDPAAGGLALELAPFAGALDDGQDDVFLGAQHQGSV